MWQPAPPSVTTHRPREAKRSDRVVFTLLVSLQIETPAPHLTQQRRVMRPVQGFSNSGLWSLGARIGITITESALPTQLARRRMREVFSATPL